MLIQEFIRAAPVPMALFEADGWRLAASNSAWDAVMGLPGAPGQSFPAYLDENASGFGEICALLSPEHGLQDFELRLKSGASAMASISCWVSDGSAYWVVCPKGGEVEREASKLGFENQLLAALVRAQSSIGRSGDLRSALSGALGELLALADCEYGFIGERLFDEQGALYLRVHALRGLAEEGELAAQIARANSGALEFRQISDFFGPALIDRDLVICNDIGEQPSAQRRMAKVGLPLHSFMALPCEFEGKLALIALANRPSPFTHALANALQPFVELCASVLAQAQRAPAALPALNAGAGAASGLANYDLGGIKELFSCLRQGAGIARGKDFEVLHANEALQALSGGALVGVKLQDLFTPTDRVNFMGVALIAALDKGSWSGELHMLRSDGERRPCLVSLSRLPSKEGQELIGIFINDMSEKKRQSQELSRLALVAERARSIILLIGPDGGVEWVNPAFSQATGYEFSQIQGKRMETLFAPEQQGAQALLQDAMRRGRGCEVEARIQRADGSCFWLRAQLSSSQEPGASGMRHILVGADVTEERELSARLEDQYQCLTELHGISIDPDLEGMSKVDAYLDFGIHRFRMGFALVNRHVGPELEVLACRSAQGLAPFAPGHRFDASRLFCGMLRDRESPFHIANVEAQEDLRLHPCSQEMGVKSYLGATLIIDGAAFGTLAFGSSRPTLSLGAWEKVIVGFISQAVCAQLSHVLSTERLQARVEERTRELTNANTELRHAMRLAQSAQGELIRQERLAALGSLVAGVAHDLAGPIGNSRLVADGLGITLKEFSERLQGNSMRRADLSAFTGRVQEAQQVLGNSLSKAGELVSAFKQFSSDQTSERRREFDISELFEEVELSLRPTWRKTAHQISFQIKQGARMDSYPGALGRVMMSVAAFCLSKSLSARASGGELKVRGEISDEGLLITIEDDGVGVDKGLADRLFEPFSGAQGTPDHSNLGLSVAWSLAKKVLGGELRFCETQPPVFGARFRLTVPLRAPTGRSSP